MRDNNKPILVTGLVRFGTSWTGEMISFSDNVCQLFEPFHPDHRCVFGSKKIKYHFHDVALDDFTMDAYVEGLVSNRFFIIKELFCAKNLKDILRACFKYLPLKIRYYFSDPRILIKDPYAFFLAEWLNDKFNFKNIVLIRHPVAFVESFTRNMSWDRHSICNSLVNQKELLSQYDLLEFEDDLLKFSKMEMDVKKHLSVGFEDKQLRLERASLIWNIFAKTYIAYKNKHDWIFLKYEDLALSPVKEFQAVYEALSMEFTLECKDKINKYCSVNNKVKSKKFVDLKRNSKSLVRSWEKNMETSDIQYVKSLTKLYGESIYADDF